MSYYLPSSNDSVTLGLPLDGLTGQLLAKASDTDFDLVWVNPPAGTGDEGSGAAATIQVGSVTTGAAGSAASVSNAGTSSAAIFNFTIPRGNPGEDGTNGSAATIQVGSVATGAAGSAASVSNAGTSSAAIFNFTIPRGEAGPVAGTTGQIVFNNDGSAGGLTPLGLAISGANLATLVDPIIGLTAVTAGPTAAGILGVIGDFPYSLVFTSSTAVPVFFCDKASPAVTAAIELDIRIWLSGVYTSIYSTRPTIPVGANTSRNGSGGAFSTAFINGTGGFTALTIPAGASVRIHCTQSPSGGGGAGLRAQLSGRRAS